MVRKKYGRIIASVLAAATVMGGYFRTELSLPFPRRRNQRSRHPRRMASALRGFLPIIQMSAQAINRLIIQGKQRFFPWAKPFIRKMRLYSQRTPMAIRARLQM